MLLKTVSFFGSSTDKPGSMNYQAAHEVAKAVSNSGRIIINGGGPGVMLAATLGAKEVNGKVVVVYYKPELATTFEGRTIINYSDKHYAESNYVMRTKKLLELGDAYIVFNGGTGTLSEFAMAWGVARLYFGHNKPLILYGKFWKDVMRTLRKNMEIRPREKLVYKIINTPNGVVRALDNYEKIIKKNLHRHKKCTGPECNLFL
jgi:uncharacterized protein (TIGR00725 family)